jgi:hypothetical protein
MPLFTYALLLQVRYQDDEDRFEDRDEGYDRDSDFEQEPSRPVPIQRQYVLRYSGAAVLVLGKALCWTWPSGQRGSLACRRSQVRIPAVVLNRHFVLTFC